MIENIITGIKISAAVIVVCLAYYFYNDYTNLKEELQTTQSNLKISEDNNLVLKTLASDNADTIDKLQKDSRFIRTLNTELISRNNDYNIKVQELREQLDRNNKKSLDELATKKPQRVQKVLNIGTHKMKLCLEKESGAKGEEYEKIDCK